MPLGVYVRTVPAPDSCRSAGGDVGAGFTAGVQAAIRDLQRHGIKPALFTLRPGGEPAAGAAPPARFRRPSGRHC